MRFHAVPLEDEALECDHVARVVSLMFWHLRASVLPYQPYSQSMKCEKAFAHVEQIISQIGQIHKHHSTQHPISVFFFHLSSCDQELIGEVEKVILGELHEAAYIL